VLFTGGGTAGHVIPAIPVIRRLEAAGVEIGFVGSRSGLEADLLRDEPLRYFAISSGKLRRYFSFENLLDAFRVVLGVLDALLVIARFRPDVVFSKGGFVSFPVVFAAWLWRLPVVAHESDLSPGLANRLSLPFIRTLCVNFPVTRPAKFKGKVLYTGTPVREALLAGDADEGRRLLGIDATTPILLVTGGSLGADVINETLRRALPELCRSWHVVHICGPGKKVEIDNERYSQFEYVRDQWGHILAAADLVVSRAGANTLYELVLLGKVNLLIPLSKRVSRGDQIENAAYAREHGYSAVLDEDDLNPQSLVSAVEAVDSAADDYRRALGEFTAPDSVTLLSEEIQHQVTAAAN
jgi:UDP-N-acetylglucosamine--N-acetylmuramyl-(pentapeptide) pyrophosphoryl-undecaprenol N-acetylglucosamine transferase